ncbi:thiamine biosynthesis protein ThiS [Legionella lansingensis]|uniref:Thiamine biosynthesis protein ThiS n=1 Tax=Legionella lansingensis TaxID=45067 RepID=A0A0W0VMQ1_9GAMM|nr:sulfur carrier protein ThiS [Legionella lansingensis]KTD21424.1 thiamine biosynthesis protein ThiS [Legionella lansingensis]SNV51974.1 thiamine biosynthesis protein ThiS [Legionella lansingensis]
MMTIYLNNERMSITKAMSLQELLFQYNQVDKPVAIAVNNCVIPRAKFIQTKIKDGDRIDLIVPMQGG